MIYVCVTDVDSKTGIPCTEKPMTNGPTLPRLVGFEFMWADESNYPVPTKPDGSYLIAPRYYGICLDGADTGMPGVLSTHSYQEFMSLWEQEKLARRNIAYNEKPYDSWLFDEEYLEWYPPVPYPDQGDWEWNENLLNWQEVS
jgi:hypothetical protein